MEFLKAIRDIVVILGPLLSDLFKALKDKEIRDLTKDLQNAKTHDDKLAVSARIAAKLRES